MRQCGVNNGTIGLKAPAPFSASTGVPQRSDTGPGVFRYAKYGANRHFFIIGILLQTTCQMQATGAE